mgnify:CR=1 FL=1
MIELYFIIIMMIAAALAAVSLPGLLSSVIALGVAGQALLLVYIFLQAPDLAVAHLVVEIIVVAVLIRATMKRDAVSAGQPKNYLPVSLGAVFAGIFIYGGYLAASEISPFGEPLMKVSGIYIRNCLNDVYACNVISAVLLDYRIMDTMVLVAAVFCGAISVYAVLRKSEIAGKEDKGE